MNIWLSKLGLIDANNEAFQQAVHGAFVDTDIITSPTVDAVAVPVPTTVKTKVASPVHYVSALKTVNQNLTNGVAADIIFDTFDGNVESKNGFQFKLFKGRAYRLAAGISAYGMDAQEYITFAFTDLSNNVINGAKGIVFGPNATWGANPVGTIETTITPTADTWIKLRALVVSDGASTLLGSQANYGQTWVSINSVGPRNAEYIHAGTQVQIRLKASGEITYDSGEVAGLDVLVDPDLASLTEYEVRARHKNSNGSDYWVKWSPWQTFTTA